MSSLDKSLVPVLEPDSLKALDLAIRGAVDATYNDFASFERFLDFVRPSGGSELLDNLAKNFDIEYWELGWERDIKLAFLRDFRYLKRHAGTMRALYMLIDIFINGARIIQWYDDDADENLKAGRALVAIPSELTRYNNALRTLLNIYKPAWLELRFGRRSFIPLNFSKLVMARSARFKLAYCSVVT